LAAIRTVAPYYLDKISTKSPKKFKTGCRRASSPASRLLLFRELEQFDNRMLADIGITMDRGVKFDGQITAAMRSTPAVTFLRQ